jgi:hypothetical protein
MLVTAAAEMIQSSLGTRYAAAFYALHGIRRRRPTPCIAHYSTFFDNRIRRNNELRRN